jgi:hypothetical protein
MMINDHHDDHQMLQHQGQSLSLVPGFASGLRLRPAWPAGVT